MSLDNPYYLDVNAKKMEEIRDLLESREPLRKFEAMKRAFGFISKGLNVSELFPSVVKSIITPSLDVKRLVFQYIVHYAEVNPDLCLLCVDKLHKDIVENQNPLLRALSLRVLSSIRSRDIVHVVARDVQKASTDSSPFVRKAAALAIPKICSLDPEQNELMIECITTLLKDTTTMVLGPAIFAFWEICPTRWDLIHPQFRKICHLLVDLDEWSQCIGLRMLLHYARIHFVSPMSGNPESCHQDSSAPEQPGAKKGIMDDVDAFFGCAKAAPGESDADAAKRMAEAQAAAPPEMDADHRLLLRSVLPLLLSRNPAVVFGVATLFFYCAPEVEFVQAVRALIRLTYESTEMAAIALQNIAVMAAARPTPFAPFVKDFFVRVTDAPSAKLMRLDILTRIVNTSNVRLILKEFEAYVHMADKNFVCATIRAIARCAVAVPDMIDGCLHGLLGLVNAYSEAVVAEAVVAIKNLLLQFPRDQDNSKIIKHLTRLLPDIKIPAARASIIWVMGEYCEAIRTMGPDCLRLLVKGFCEEQPDVKSQILTLAVKLHLCNPEQTTALLQHVLNLARYDISTDLRDRARLFRALLLDQAAPALSAHVRDLFRAEKPRPDVAPVDASATQSRFTLGTLSHMVGRSCLGYEPLPSFATVPSDPSLRTPPPSLPGAVLPWEAGNKYVGLDKTVARATAPTAKAGSSEDFYGNGDESDSGSSSGSSSGSGSGSDSGSDSESGSGSGSESDASGPRRKRAGSAARSRSQSASSKSSRSSSASGSGSESESGSEDEAPRRRHPQSSGGDLITLAAESSSAQSRAVAERLAALALSPPASEASSEAFARPTAPLAAAPAPGIQLPLAMMTLAGGSAPRRHVLCQFRRCGGVQVECQFTRKPSLYSQKMCNIRLFFTNNGSSTVKTLSMRAGPAENGQSVQAFPEIGLVSAGSTVESSLNVDFNDRTSALKFDVCVERSGDRPERGVFPVQLIAPAGELLRPLQMPESVFQAEADKMQGLMESTGTFTPPMASLQGDALVQYIGRAVAGAANMQPLPPAADGTLRWAAETLAVSTKMLLRVNPTRLSVAVCSDNIVLASELCEAIVEALEKGPQ